MAYIDTNGPFYQRLEVKRLASKNTGSGIMNKVGFRTPVTVVAKGYNGLPQSTLEEATKKPFVPSPIDISMFLATIGLGLMAHFLFPSAGQAMAAGLALLSIRRPHSFRSKSPLLQAA